MPRVIPPAREAGVALPSVLFTLVGVVLASATLLFGVFLDLVSASSVAASRDALFVAEAGIHDLWSILGRGSDFAVALDWPDGTPPFGPTVDFPSPPRSYRVRVSPGPDGSLVAVSEGTSHRQARARVETWFRRETDFRPPAALIVEGPGFRLRQGGTITVSTSDGAGAVGAARPQDAVAWAAGARDPMPVDLVGSPGLAEILDTLRSAPDYTLSGPLGADEWGSVDHPAVVRVVSNADVGGDVVVHGILLADAPLRVHASLTVDGLLLAASGIAIDGQLSIDGAAWVAGDLDVAGRLEIAFVAAALDRADSSRPGVFPRDAVLGAWRQLW